MAFTFSSYLEYAAAQQRDVITNTGLMIYSTNNQPIPMYVFFIPCENPNGKSLHSLVQSTLSDTAKSAYVTYFQGIRWTLENVADLIRELEYLDIQYGKNKAEMKISYVTMLFDKTFTKDNIEKVPEPVNVNVKIDSSEYKLRVFQDSGEHGVLKSINEIK